MLSNKFIYASDRGSSLPAEWAYFRTLADENSSAFLIASGGVDTISFSSPDAFVMKVYGGINGTDLLYCIDANANSVIDLWSADLENFPKPDGLLFSKLQGKPYSDNILGNVELFTVVISGVDGNSVYTSLAGTLYHDFSFPQYRILACDVNFPDSQGFEALRNCKDLEFVFFKEGMTSIPNKMFMNSGLKRIEIPNTITSIGEYAFSQCDRLKEVILPDSVLILNEGLFNECSSLEKVRIPQYLTSVYPKVFYGCKSLKSVSLPSTIEEFYPYMLFYGCELLDSFEFTGKNYSAVDGTNMFYNCHQLRYVYMPNIILGTFGCSGKVGESKCKIGYAKHNYDNPIILDFSNFDCESELFNIVWDTSYTELTEEQYLNIFSEFFNNNKYFLDKTLIITGSVGATDEVRDFISIYLCAICVG